MRALVAIGTALILVAAPSAGFAALCDAMARGTPCATAPRPSSPCGSCHKHTTKSETPDACAHCWFAGASAAQELTPAAATPAPPAFVALATSATVASFVDRRHPSTPSRDDEGPPAARPLTVLLCTYRI